MLVKIRRAVIYEAVVEVPSGTREDMLAEGAAKADRQDLWRLSDKIQKEEIVSAEELKS